MVNPLYYRKTTGVFGIRDVEGVHDANARANTRAMNLRALPLPPRNLRLRHLQRGTTTIP